MDESKSKKWLTEAAVIALTVAAALLAFGVAEDAVKRAGYVLPPQLYTNCLLGGAVLLILGLALLALRSLTVAGHVVISRRAPRDVSYECLVAKARDLQQVHDFAAGFFTEEGVSELRKMQQCHRINPNIFWQVVEVRKRGRSENRKMVGYYSLIPLKKRASQLVEAEELNGTMFTTEHIIRDGTGVRRAVPTSVYVGGIAADGRTARAATLKALMDHLEREKRNGVAVVYTRPTTKDGLRLASRRGFRSVRPARLDELNVIYKFQYPAAAKKAHAA